MKYPLIIDLQRDGIPVVVSCRVLKLSKQGFYKWKANPITDRDWEQAHIINAAVDVHADEPGFGYRFIADELKDAGIGTSENRVWRLCRIQSIWSVHSKKPGLNRKADPPVHDDLVKREFAAKARDELWLTDITEHPTDEGKLYLCAIKDVYSHKIVGYSIEGHMRKSLAVNALRNAIVLRNPDGTILHSDRGSQFRAKTYVQMLKNNGLVGSMGRVGACGDNAAMESFFSLLQKNVLDTRRWKTRDELRHAVVVWIERTYNRRRRQRSLGKLTPVQFEAINSAELAA